MEAEREVAIHSFLTSLSAPPEHKAGTKGCALILLFSVAKKGIRVDLKFQFKGFDS